MAMKHLAQRQRLVYQRPRDCGAVRHPDRVDGQCCSAWCAPAFWSPRQGTRGGYTLSRPSASISVADVIQAIDGPVTVTACSTEKNDCEQYSKCSIRDPLWQIRERIVAALDTVTIAEMAAEGDMAHAPVARAAVLHQQARTERWLPDLHGLSRHDARRPAGGRGDAAVFHRALRQRRQPQPSVRLGGGGGGGQGAQAGGRPDRRQREGNRLHERRHRVRTTSRSRASPRCIARRATTSSRA